MGLSGLGVGSDQQVIALCMNQPWHECAGHPFDRLDRMQKPGSSLVEDEVEATITGRDSMLAWLSSWELRSDSLGVIGASCWFRIDPVSQSSCACC
jgi:hypothetical protein